MDLRFGEFFFMTVKNIATTNELQLESLPRIRGAV